MNLIEIKKQFLKKGYVVIDLDSLKKKIHGVNKGINKILNSKNIKKNPKVFHYNGSPRIVEAWKKESEIKDIVKNRELLKVLKFLKNRKPIPFSTINFLKGTEQPLHSDYFHFATKPHYYLIGAWVALEDINIKAGPLAIVEKSHKLPIISNEILNQKIPKNQFELKKNYTKYENYVKKLIIKKKLKVTELPIKKGQVILWDANALHGAYKIKNRKLTRKSMVIHYHFTNCEKYYNPLYSLISKKIYSERNIKKIRIQ